MKSKAISTTVLTILSIQNLLASTAHAGSTFTAATPEHNQEREIPAQNPDLADRIIQKRLVGFDPKQAIETLSYLYDSGVQRFEKDGSVHIDKQMIPDLMEAAAVDDIEVRILGLEHNTAKVKFAAHDPKKFDPAGIEKAKELAKAFRLKCDMDGKSM